MVKKSTTFKGAPKPFGASGHFNESRRHSLQARGIKTGNLSSIAPYFGQGKEFLRQSGKYAGEPEKLARMMETDSDKDGVPDVKDLKKELKKFTPEERRVLKVLNFEYRPNQNMWSVGRKEDFVAETQLGYSKNKTKGFLMKALDTFEKYPDNVVFEWLGYE